MWWLWLLLLLPAYIVYDWWRRRPWVEGITRKAVLITGCDTGFGRAAARSLYKRGVYVYAGCYTESGAQALREETGERLMTIILDVTRTESIQKALQYVQETLPASIEFWGVVNNAGVPGHNCPVEFLTRDDVRQVFEVNVFGMLDVTNVFLPLLKKSRGRVVNVASIAAEFPFPNMMPYCASKHAARGYSDTLRHEKMVWGIGVSTVQPAFYRTNIVDIDLHIRRYNEKWSQLDPTLKADYGEDYGELSSKLMSGVLQKALVDNLDSVVAVYEHALFSIHPRDVYYPGTQAKILRYTPAFITELLSPAYFILPKAVRDRK